MLSNFYLTHNTMIQLIQITRQYLKLFIAGGFIGIANLIPGVSGATIAVILGVYDPLILAFKSILSRQDMKSSAIFLLCIFCGASISIIGFSSLLLDYISLREKELSFIFIGLILGSIPIVLRLSSSTSSSNKLSIKLKLFYSALGLLLLAGLSLFTPNGLQSITPTWANTWWYYMISGIIAAASMVIPGLSGSLILIIMGIYTPILTAISSLNIVVLVPFSVGVMLGFIIMIRLVSWCLTHHKETSVWIIIGLLLGSTIPLFSPIPFSYIGLKYILFLSVGIIFASRLNRINQP